MGLHKKYFLGMGEVQTTIYIDERLDKMLKAESETWGTQKNVVNAALYMFATASMEAKAQAIKAFPRSKLAPGNSGTAGADRVGDDLGLPQADPPAVKRKRRRRA